MGVLDDGWKPLSPAAMAEKETENTGLITNIGGKDYRVIDGDTIVDVESNQSYRLQGLDAREVAKPDYYGAVDKTQGAAGLTKGETGGLDQRYTTWKILQSGEFDNLEDLGSQEYGAGAGNRNLARITDKKGNDFVETLYRAGVADITEQSGNREINAARDGDLERAFQGVNAEQGKYGEFITLRKDEPTVFKGLALDENWYNPDFYSGIQFDDKNIENWNPDRETGGLVINPVSAAWDTGWSNAKADFGAALDALGVGVDSEWLQSTGRDLRISAGDKLAESGKFPVQSLSDIRTDDYMTTAKDGLEWLLVNSTMSLPYMAAIAAPTILTGGLGGVAGFAASTLPSTLLHTGAVWNEIDHDKKDKAAVGASVGAGLLMGSLDRLGIAGLIKPSAILTKEGMEKAVKLIADRDGISKEAAQLVVNKATKDELTDTLSYLGNQANDYIIKGKKFKNAMRQIVATAPAEGVTEAGQEITSYLTASAINGTEIDFDHLQSVAIESAIAGAAVGGVYGGAGAAVGSARDYAKERARDIFSLDTMNEWRQVFLEQANKAGGDPDGSIASQIIQTKEVKRDNYNGGADVEGLAFTLAEQSKNDPVWKDYLYDDSGKLSISPASVAAVSGHYAGRLVKAPLLNWITPDDLRNNAALRTIVSRTTNVRGVGGAGKHYEGRRDYLGGQYKKLLDQTRVADIFGLGTSNKAADKWSKDFRRVGSSGLYDAVIKARKQGRKISDDEISQFGFDPVWARKAIPFADQANRATNIMFNHKRDALVKEYGKDSKKVKEYDKARINGWWWKSNSPDRSKIAANPEKFQSLIKRAMDKALNDPKLSKKDKDAILSKTAEQRLDELLHQDPNSDSFTLVGGVKWGTTGSNRRLLNLTELEDKNADGSTTKPFDEFASDNYFANFNSHADQYAKEVSHLEYFGDGGSDLDVLADMAIKQEMVRGLSEEEATKKVSRLMRATVDAIDASSGNYNRIENRTLAALQRGVVGYMTLVGLPLAMLSSFPEFAVIALDASSIDEFKTAINHSVKNVVKGTYRTMEKVPRWGINKLRPGTPVKLNDTTFLSNVKERGTLEALGIEESAGALFQKLGVDESLPSSQIFRKVLDGFFTVTGIRGITSIQRQSAMAFGFDFSYNRLVMLAKVPQDRPFTQAEGEAYSQLNALGMDVDSMLDVMRRGSIYSKDQLQYSSPLEANVRLTKDERIIEENMSTFLQNFVNERIQNPGAFNRPLLFQDPHWAMLTVFNGFLSTFTANIVPKLWNDKALRGLRTKNPSMTLETFTLMATMVALGAVGQSLKDYVKYGGTPDWLEDEDLVHRAFLAGGIFGQYERLGDIAFPLYGKQEGYGERLTGSIGGPALFVAGNIKNAVSNAAQGNTDVALKNFLKLSPGFGAVPLQQYKNLINNE